MATTFYIKVVPSSGKSGFTQDKSGMLKAFLKSPPEDGKANRELIKQISQALDITQNEVTILSGLASRKKRIKVSRELTEDELFACLGMLERQKKLI